MTRRKYILKSSEKVDTWTWITVLEINTVLRNSLWAIQERIMIGNSRNINDASIPGKPTSMKIDNHVSNPFPFRYCYANT